MAMPATQQSSTFRLSKDEYFAGIGYTPHAGQHKVHLAHNPLLGHYKPFRVIVAGRRWGKSKCASKEGGSELINPGTLGCIVAPGHDQTAIVLNEIEQDLLSTAGLNGHVKTRHKSAPRFLEFDWGSSVRGFSADNIDAARGYKFNWMVFDEPAQCNLSAWEEVLEATLQDMDGWVLFITTPQGYNWMYDFYMRGKDPNEPEWFSLQSPTWDNPYHNKKRLATAKRNLSEAVYRQEYGAEFTIMSGQVYSEFNYDTHVIPHNEMNIPKSWPRYRGIDWGYNPDPFAMLWFAKDGEDRLYIYHEYVKRRRSLPKHAKFLVEKVSKRQKSDREIRLHGVWRTVSRNKHIPPFDTRETHYEYTIADPHGAGRSNMATMLEYGIPCWGVSTRIEDGLDKVRQRLAIRDDGTPGIYVSSACVETIKEFNLYSYPESDSRNVGDDPIDYNNHCMDIIRYLVMSFRYGNTQNVRPRMG
jgi:phage terminase large subunit